MPIHIFRSHNFPMRYLFLVEKSAFPIKSIVYQLRRLICLKLSLFRTCEEMLIPEEYCVCLHTWDPVNPNDTEVIKAAHTLITDINHYIESKNLSHLCSTLSFSNVIRYIFEIDHFHSNENFEKGLFLLALFD